MNPPSLRPMSLGELLDHVFTLYRRHFTLFAGIAILPVAIGIGLSLLIQIAQRPLLLAQAEGAAAFAALLGASVLAIFVFLAGFLALLVVFVVSLAAATHAVWSVTLGISPGIRAAYAAVRGKAARLVGLILMIVLRIFGYMTLLGTLGAILIALPAALLGNQVLTLTLTIVFIVLMITAMVVLSLRYSLAVPALVLEDASISGAIRRSIALAHDFRWRILLTYLLTLAIGYAAFFIFQMPFFLMTISHSLSGTTPPFWIGALQAVSAGASGLLTWPLTAIAFAALYLDIRVHKEALDLQVMMQSLDRQGAAGGDPGPPAPDPPPPGSLSL